MKCLADFLKSIVITDKCDLKTDDKWQKKLGPLFKKFEDFTSYTDKAKEAKLKEDYSKLYSLCVEFLKKYPENVIANFDLADLYTQTGEIERVCEILDKLCNYYPKEKHFLKAQKEMFELDNKVESIIGKPNKSE